MQFAQTLVHYFYPTFSNNHKARVLHSPVLLFLSVLLIFYQVVLDLTTPLSLRVLGYASNIPPLEVANLTNQKRAEAGVPALQYSETLSRAAKAKGEHMLANDYWAHVAPDGTEPWRFFNDAGYEYRYAGENLARDFTNPASAVDAWMASPSHKENMLSSKYKEIGIAVVEGDLGGTEATIVVQLFGTQLVDTTPEVAIGQAQANVQSETVLPSVTLTLAPTATPVPTHTPSSTPTAVPEQLIANTEPVSDSGTGIGVLLSPFGSTKTISGSLIVILLVILVIDGIVTFRRKLPRVGGRTFAHIAFFGMVFAIVLIAKAGEIL